jgi:serine/threonine protein kinase
MDATAVDPLVGQVLDRRYRIDSRVARGGMATVYLSHDLKLDRTVALKVMHPGLAQDDDFVRRFIHEAKSAAALSHPNIVSVFDQGTDGSAVYLAMEYVPGRTLRDVLTQRGRLGPREALKLMQPVLAALAVAHRAGLIHRDVKPENVLVMDDGRIKVADFGLARAESASKQTKTGVLLGTATSPPSRCSPAPPMRGPTSMPPASCCSSCSRGGSPTPATLRWRSRTSTSTTSSRCRPAGCPGCHRSSTRWWPPRPAASRRAGPPTPATSWPR